MLLGCRAAWLGTTFFIRFAAWGAVGWLRGCGATFATAAAACTDADAA